MLASPSLSSRRHTIPLEFPCKENYEKINVTIEGLKEKDRLEGSPDYLPLPPPEAGDDQDDDQDGDDAGDDDKGDGGGDGPDGGHRSGVDPSIMAEVEELEFMGAEDAARRADLPPPPGLEEPAPSSSSKPDRVIVPDNMIEHYLEGKAGDNIVYLNNDGEKVKIDTMGRLYRVDDRGYKIVRDSPRPAKYTPTEWQAVPHETRKEIIRVQEMEAEAARERSKVERKIKDAEKTSKSKDEKKKAKEEKKKTSSSKSKKKDKGPDHDVGVSVGHEYSRPGKIFGIGKRSTSDDECDGKHKLSSAITPSGCRSSALISTNDMSDTDVPDDDDFLMEWDEWSEVEKGFGPKATWSNEKSYDFTNGKVVASAPRSFAPGDTINDPDKQNVYHSFPCMPCVHQCDQPHREKLGENYNGIDINQIFNTAVSRPVGRKEMMEDEDARKSMRISVGGCLPGNDVKLADAIQAYIQAKLTGPPCWVELPEDAWPDDIDFRKFRRPVVLLVKALYGHPDSGTMWEQHCDRKVKELDFVPVGEEWPSMYFHKGLKLLLVIYVDDLKLSGPKENLAKGWEMLRTKLNIEPETDLGLYLGCLLKKGTTKLHDGTSVSTMTYDMEGLLKLSVEKYLEIVGKDTKLKKVSTPSLPEETKTHKSRAPCPGDPKKAITCPWCSHQFDSSAPLPYKHGTTGEDVTPGESDRGALAPHAASILMKLLYAARIARFDLLRSRLAARLPILVYL
eukprot:s370_g19.t1